MDKVYIKTRDLEYYQQIGIDNAMKELNMNLQDFISTEQLVEIICQLYSQYVHLDKEYKNFINYLDGKRS